MLHTTLVPIDLESSGEFIFIRYHDFCNMGGERLTLQVEQTIRTLSKEGNSYSVIVKKLKAEGLDVGKATICRVVNGIGKKREAESNGQKYQVDRPRPVRTPATVSKVKRLATTENPPSQRQLSRMCGTSLKTINNIIHKDLELDTRRKGKVHKLTPFHMKNRATNARKLYEEHLAGSRSEYTATLDEAWMYVTYCNGIRKICYIKRGNQVPDNWVHQCSETFPKGFMVVGVMTGRGVLPLIKVPSKVKVNSEFYIESVLKPVIEQLKDLYPGEMDKVFLHHDKASSHTSNKTQQFLQEMKDTLGLIFIRNSDIPVKSPDASPLDFYGFGYTLRCGDFTMEQKLNQRICIEFCVKLQISETDTFEMLNKAFPNNAPKRTTVFEWHSRFKAGRISIEDDPRQGRPTFRRTDENVQKITDLIKENPRTTLLELEQDTGISKTTIGRIVTEDLRLKKTSAKFIPRFLTNEQKLCRLSTCEDMLEMTRTDPEWKDKIITGDETWVYGYDPETKRQSAEWRGQGEPRPKKFRILKSRNKVLLVAFLNNKGIVHHEYPPAGQTVIKEMYLSILRRLREAIRKKRPEKWTNGDWILHHDNARPHTARVFWRKTGQKSAMERSLEQRYAIKVCVRLGKNATETFQMLQKAFKDDCISRSQSGKWYKAFKEGREEVADEPRSGRPTTARTDENVDRVLEVLRTDRRSSIQRIADTLHMSTFVVNRIMTEDLQMPKVCAKLVPKVLTQDQKELRVLRCQELLDLIQNEPGFLNSVVTGDESWMFEYDPESKRQHCAWHTISSPRPKKARMSKSCIKTIIIVFFDIRGIVHCEFVPQGQTVNSAFYLEVFRRLKRRIARVRTDIKDTVKLHHDNATSHTAFIITIFLARSNTPVIPDPPYSPDLAPCDFFL
ncbi:hypothetical protein LAZ67_14002137, partial [Cordylochernes scorpioides]